MIDADRFCSHVERIAGQPPKPWVPDLERRVAWTFRSADHWRLSDLAWAATEVVRDVDLDQLSRRELRERLWLLESVATVVLEADSEDAPGVAVLAAVAELAVRAGRIQPEKARLALEVQRCEAKTREAREALESYGGDE